MERRHEARQSRMLFIAGASALLLIVLIISTVRVLERAAPTPQGFHAHEKLAFPTDLIFGQIAHSSPDDNMAPNFFMTASGLLCVALGVTVVFAVMLSDWGGPHHRQRGSAEAEAAIDFGLYETCVALAMVFMVISAVSWGMGDGILGHYALEFCALAMIVALFVAVANICAAPSRQRVSRTRYNFRAVEEPPQALVDQLGCGEGCVLTVAMVLVFLAATLLIYSAIGSRQRHSTFVQAGSSSLNNSWLNLGQHSALMLQQTSGVALAAAGLSLHTFGVQGLLVAVVVINFGVFLGCVETGAESMGSTAGGVGISNKGSVLTEGLLEPLHFDTCAAS